MGSPVFETSANQRVRSMAVGLGSVVWLPWAIAGYFDFSSPNWFVTALFSGYTYVAIWTAGMTVLGMLAQRWPAVVCAAFGTVTLVLPLADRATKNVQPPVAVGTDVTVLALNLNRGRADPRAVVQVIREYRVDIAAFVELTPPALAALNSIGMAGTLPSQQTVPGAGSGGLGTVNRLGGSWDARLLPPSRPWIPTAVRLGPTRTLHVETIHAAPPRPRGRGLSARRLFDQLPPPQIDGSPVIIVGDFNSTLDGPELKRLLRRGYRDAAAELGLGLKTTWSGFAGLARLPIDHVLVPRGVAVSAVSIVNVEGSDHRAVIARLRIPV